MKMNLRVLGTSLLLLSAIALLGYGFHQSINAALGLKESFFDSLMQSLAVAVGLSILVAFAYPHLRGVRTGDLILASVPRAHSTPRGVFAFVENATAIALEDGRVGQKIKVRLSNGRTGEGVIEAYAGAFAPPSVQITETEMG